MKNEILYDCTGAVFALDHELHGTAYVRPMVKVIVQSTIYSGDDFIEETDYEPADYIVSRPSNELFHTPPVKMVEQKIVDLQNKLSSLASAHNKAMNAAATAERTAKRDVETAQRQLSDWMTKHKVMHDLGRLLDGTILYPLRITENHYHKSHDIPIIPEMRNSSYIRLSRGNWETGESWSSKRYSSDSYGSDFQFYDTEDERADAIKAAFERTCDAFRKAPDFAERGGTYTTQLDLGTLKKWVEIHPALSIPDDIMAAKAQDDEAKLEARRAKLAAELAQIGGTP